MIGYYLWLKLKLVFSPRNNIWGFVGLVLLIPLAILYGQGIATLIDGRFVEFTKIVRSVFKMGLLGFIAVITFVRGFFPSYKPIRSHFKSFHPIPLVSRFMLNILGDLICGYFIIMSTFVVAFFFFSNTVALEYLLYLVLVLIGAHILRRFFQTLFENKVKFNRQSFLLLFTCISLFLLSAGLLFFFERFAFWGIISCFLFLSFGDFVLEELCPKERMGSKSTGKTNRNPTIDLLWQNQTVRTTLIVAVFFKVLILSLDLIIYSKMGAHLANNVFLIFLFISPLILFTYLFNNSWGFFRNYWIITDRSLSTGQGLFNIYLKILWLPLAVDVIISMTYLAFGPSNLILPGISMYVASLFLLTVGGFFWSIQAPVQVEKAFAFKVNTSTFGSVVSIGIVSSFLTLFISEWFYLLVPIYIILSLIMLKWVFNNYPSKQENIYSELYK